MSDIKPGSAMPVDTKESACNKADIAADKTGVWKKACKIERSPFEQLRGVISDAALREIESIATQRLDVTDPTKKIALDKRIGRVIVAELDIADGKVDGIIERSTIARKLDLLEKNLGSRLDPVGKQLARETINSMPQTITTADAMRGFNAFIIGANEQPKQDAPKIQVLPPSTPPAIAPIDRPRGSMALV